MLKRVIRSLILCRSFDRFDWHLQMVIKELVSFSKDYVEGLDALMGELSPGARATENRVRKCIEDENMHLYAAFEEERMVGCATLCVCTTPEMVTGFVEAVVVTAVCRGQHLGRNLMERVIDAARQYGVQRLHLTSNPNRIEANGLYQSMGFQNKETNVYVMNIN